MQGKNQKIITFKVKYLTNYQYSVVGFFYAEK